MKAEERTISKILTEQIRYEIPAYQRPYSWQTENVEQLLDDIWEAFKANDPEYFIGSLITIEKSKDELYEIVDGQQRLTTLNLIICRLRDKITNPEVKADLAKRILPKNPYTDIAEAPRLTIRPSDMPFFRKYAIDGEIIPPDVRNKIEQNQDRPKLCIADNLKAIGCFFEEPDETTLKQFANYILSRVYIVFVTTDSFNSAYRLFNVLNARGLSLSNADLIKNRLFSDLQGNDEQNKELENRWLELEKTIGIDRLDQFFAHHRSASVAAKARSALHEEYGAITKPYASPFEFLVDLQTSAENYVRILQCNFPEAEAQRAINSLNRVAFEEWIPPLLAFLNKPVENMDVTVFLELLEKTTYQNWVRRLALTARLTVYFQLISAIKGGKSATDIHKIVRDNAQNAEFKTLINGDVYGKPFAKAVLLRIEEHAHDTSVTLKFDGKVTIEHILPQTMTDPYWTSRFDKDTHRTWLHRLGNLALLSGIKNYKAKNYSFEEKQAAYKDRGRITSFETTKPLLQLKQWSTTELAERQEMLTNAALEIWSIN